MSAVTLSPAEALELIAQEPTAHDKTAADLHEAADDYQREADEKDRLASSRITGNRRRSRLEKARRDAHAASVRAQVVRRAAEEMERLGAETVGEAVRKGWLRRAVDRIRGRG